MPFLILKGFDSFAWILTTILAHSYINRLVALINFSCIFGTVQCRTQICLVVPRIVVCFLLIFCLLLFWGWRCGLVSVFLVWALFFLQSVFCIYFFFYFLEFLNTTFVRTIIKNCWVVVNIVYIPFFVYWALMLSPQPIGISLFLHFSTCSSNPSSYSVRSVY